VKKKEPPVQKVIAENVQAMMDVGRNGLRTQAAIADAAKKAGHPLDQKSVSRVLKAATAPQADTIEAIARAFDIEPYQLLIPGLDPKNPQVLRSLSPIEERLYRALEEARRGDAKAGTQ
jgi:transcriptional regulator with XRE-family HTH domain